MRTKWIYTMFVLALSLFASCSNEADEAAGNQKTRTVVFRLSVDDAVGSRAAWGEDYAKGDADVPFDTRINLDGLQVVVYDADNRYVGKAKNILYWSVSGNENENPVVDEEGNVTSANEEYQFVGDLSELLLTENATYKFMIFANCANVNPTTNVGQLPYDYTDISPQTGTGYIPMWGVKTINLSGDELQDLETINLLRAAAKIEVGLSDEMSSAGYSLVSVTASHYNQRGWCAPTGWNTVTATELLVYEDCANYHTSTQSPANGLPFTVNADKKSAVVYMPEYNNLASTIPAVTLSVTVQKAEGTPVEYKNAIDFLALPGSTATEAVNIIRNHCYLFIVAQIKGGGLDIDYTVQDWTDGEITDLGTYEYPTYRNPILPSLPTTDNPDPTPTGEATMSTTNPFVGYFHITAPENKNWVPTISGATTDYVLEVYDQAETDLLYSTDASFNKNDLTVLETSDNWYVIKVKPVDNDTSNETVDLGITYKIGDQTGTPIYLLINGTGTETKWPGSSDPKFITIKHVE